MIEQQLPKFPDRLSRELARDFAPVRPVLPFELRASLIAVLAAACGAFFLWKLGMRADWPALPRAAIVTVLLLKLLVGVSLIILSLREAIPGSGWSDRTRTIALCAAVGALLFLPEVFARAIAFHDSASLDPSSCFAWIVAVSIPSFAGLFVLLARAYPLRPVMTGLTAGLGTGILAEAAIFLACANPAPIHGMAVHGSASIALGLLGGLAGWLIGRARLTAETT